MKRNTRKTWRKIAKTERFSLFQSTTDPRTFEVSWRKSSGYGRRRFQAPGVGPALERAPVVCGLVVSEGSGPKKFTLARAFQTALDHASRGPKATQDWLYFVERFLRWLTGTHPACSHWHLLTREIVRGYMGTFQGKSDTTRRLGLQPISQTSGFMSREYGYQDVANRL